MAPNNCREPARDEVKECIARLKDRKAAGANGTVDGFLKYGEGESLP